MSDIRSRSYGWVQNPSSFSSLHKVVCLFNPNSEHYKWMKEIGLDRIYFDDLRQSFHQKFQNNCTTFSYLELVGTSSDKNGNSSLKRNQAVADGLIQVTILPQKINTTGKTWTDNWTADGFLRWAVTLGFLKPNRQQDTYSLTDIGKEFSNIKTGDCDKAIDILTDAFLSYPPACRILDLLSNQTEYVTKFYLGSQLGFIGENGFTSYPEDLMFDWLLNSTDEEITKIRSDVEGTSDKYARGICGWLNKVGLVQKGKVVRQGKSKSRHFIGYKITAKGLSEYKRACGSSKNTKKPKFVMWEFLATATVNRDYVRSRRSFILEYLLIGSSPQPDCLLSCNQKGFMTLKKYY